MRMGPGAAAPVSTPCRSGNPLPRRDRAMLLALTAVSPMFAASPSARLPRSSAAAGAVSWERAHGDAGHLDRRRFGGERVVHCDLTPTCVPVAQGATSYTVQASDVRFGIE